MSHCDPKAAAVVAWAVTGRPLQAATNAWALAVLAWSRTTWTEVWNNPRLPDHATGSDAGVGDGRGAECPQQVLAEEGGGCRAVGDRLDTNRATRQRGRLSAGSHQLEREVVALDGNDRAAARFDHRRAAIIAGVVGDGELARVTRRARRRNRETRVSS